MLTPDDEVRRITLNAITASTDQHRLDGLSPLPGFATKYAIATALLAAYDPVEFGVPDRRALTGLERVGPAVTRGRGATLRYLDRVRALRDGVRSRRPDVLARTIDQALRLMSGP